MNAKALLALIDECGMIELVNRSGRDSDGWIQETILRALRLLAAAEGGDGTPETDEFAEHDFVFEAMEVHPIILERLEAWRKSHAAMEQHCNALAARVRELEGDASKQESRKMPVFYAPGTK